MPRLSRRLIAPPLMLSLTTLFWAQSFSARADMLRCATAWLRAPAFTAFAMLWLLTATSGPLITTPGNAAPPASGPSAQLSELLTALNRTVGEKKPAEAAPIAIEALRLAIKENRTEWIVPLASAIPALYAQAGDMAKAEPHYHRLMRALLYGDIKAPRAELQHQVEYLTDAFVQSGRPADAIASLGALLASLKTSESERHRVGTFLYRIQGQAFQKYLLYEYSSQSHGNALDLGKKAYHANSPEMAYILNDVGYAYLAATRWQEAEAPLKESLRIREQNDAANLAEIGTTCQNLVTVLFLLGDLTNAERFANRAVAARKQALGIEHPKYFESRYTLAQILAEKKDYKTAIEILEDTRIGFRNAKDFAGEADMMRRLSYLFASEGDRPKSRKLVDDAIALLDNNPRHPNTPIILPVLLSSRIDSELADGDLAGAEADTSKLLSTIKGRFAPDHNITLFSLRAAAAVYLAMGDVDLAISYGQQAMAGVESQFNRVVRGSGNEAALHGMDRLFNDFFHVASTEKGREAFSFDRTLQIVQWSELGGASLALRQMAARAASIKPELAREVREAQDLAARSRALDIRLVGLEGAPPDQRDEPAITSLRTNLQRIEAALTAQQSKITQAFPEYASLVSARPVGLAEIQKLLRDDEAIIKFYMPTKVSKEPRVFVWAITKLDKKWTELPLPAKAVADLVAGLRCGLDRAGWDHQATPQCSKLLDMKLPDTPDPALPFSLARSFELYHALFDPIADLVKGKKLIIVPSGPLTQLPFQVLVTTEPISKPSLDNYADAEHWRQASWLVRKQAISMLPSISSLQALRENAKPSLAESAFIGFGNPLLDGQQRDPEYGKIYQQLAQEARDRTTCPETFDAKKTSFAMLRPTRGFGSIFRGQQADFDELRSWSPLPETVDELCEVGSQLGASSSDIYLGSRATESNLKDLSEKGELKKYHTIHFATHGALTGEVKGTAEPGLILTPPDSSVIDPTKLARDDGFLSASEIATLSLDADLVIMAACNTAGGSGETAEALSGIARAFFYAGARTLLVSHWEVYSKATTQLMINMARSKASGRAEALRESMLTMIKEGDPREAHPAYWAPFAIVGEGAK